MSKQVDERVVSMQFDNAQFERNVSTTMSTLDKLKEKLHLNGATKGLESVNTASKNVNMGVLSSAVETVRTRFSALEVMGVTALANITNQAVNAGKRMLSALTIDPVKAGFNEYETKLGSIQTIMANTQSKGSTMEDVTRVLDELNTYSDKTIYNFAEMTRNIGTFTAAGVGLEESATAIQGIANLAAVSGSTSQQASTAMYQLSQALASGTVKLMDWNSVVNAGMGGQVFQDALKQTARVHGVAIDEMIEKEGSFRETLQNGWLTSEILTETLQNFTLCAEEGTEQWEKYKKSLMEKGYTEEQAKSILEMGKNATDAATKVKTFSQLFDTLKESAQSGWSKTWELIFGDFESARDLFTNLSNILGGFINRMSDFRNNIVEGVMDFATPWTRITEKLDKAGFGGITKVADKIGEATDKLKHFQEVVDSVWNGDYKNADTGRYDLLEKAGYDHRVVQDLVNKGRDYEITIEDVEASHKKFGLTMEETNKSTEKTAASFQKLSDEQLENAGLTEDEIKLYRDLEKEAERTNRSVDELIKTMSEKDGRSLLLESLGNVGNGLIGVFVALKDAWFEIFPPPSVARIYTIIEAINNFTQRLKVVKFDKETGEVIGFTDAGEKLVRTFKGVFAILDIVATVAGGGLRIAFKILSAILSYFNYDILDLTASIGDNLVAFRDWFDSIFNIEAIVHSLMDWFKVGINRLKEWYKSFKQTAVYEEIAYWINRIKDAFSEWFGALKSFGITGVLTVLMNLFKTGAGYISKWYNAFEQTEGFANFVSGITKIKDALTGWYKGLKETDDIPKYLLDGLINGIKVGVPMVVTALFELGKAIIDSICDVLGINSPSVVFMALGGFLIAGLVQGIISGEHGLLKAIFSIGKSIITSLDSSLSELSAKLQNGDTSFVGMVKTATTTVINFLKSIDWGAIFAAGTIIGFLAIGFKIAKTLDNITSPLEGFNEVMESASKVMNSFSLKLKADALLSIATAIAILAASILVLTFVDPGKLAGATAVIILVAGALAGLTFMVGKFGPESAKEIIKFSVSIAAIAAALLVAAFALRLIANIDSTGLSTCATVLLSFAVLMIFLVELSKTFTGAEALGKIGATMLAISGTMLIMALTLKIISGIDDSEGAIDKGIAVIMGFGAIIVGLMWATKLVSGGKNIDKIGDTIMSVAGAILLMAFVIKLLSGMEVGALVKGALAIAGLGVIIVGLMWATKLVSGSENVEKIGGAIMGVAGAMLLMALVMRIVSGMDVGALIKGELAIAGLGVIIVGLMWATKLASGGEKLEKVGMTLLLLSVAIGILAGVAALLGLIELPNLAKGVGAVAILTVMMSILVKSLKDAQKCTGTLITLTVAIGLLVTAVAVLSFIDPTRLAIATGSLTILLGMLALLITATGKLKPGKGSIPALISITAIIVVLGGVVALLSMVDAENVIPNVLALSGLLLVMTVVLVILSKLKISAKDAAIGILALLGMVVPLLALVGVLLLMNGVKNATTNATVLVGLATALTLLLYPLMLIGVIITSTAGLAALGIAALLAMAVPLLALVGVLLLMDGVKNATTNANLLMEMATVLTALLIPLTAIGLIITATVGLAALGIAALLAMAVPLLALVGVLKLMEGIENATQNAELLMTLMTCLTDLLIKISLVAPLAMMGAMAMVVITGLLAAIAVMAVGMGALMTLVPDLQKFLDAGIPVLVQLAGGLGTMIGAFIGGLASEMMAALPSIGTSLSLFMTNVTPFITGVKMVDGAVLAGAGYLTAAIMLLTVADFINGIVSFMSGGPNSLPNLGTSLSMFMTNAMPFIMGASLLSEDLVSGVKTLAETILILTAADIVNGLASLLGGGSSLEDFGSQIGFLGTGLKSFSQNLGAFTEEQLTTVKCASEAVKTLAQASSTIPNAGGLIGMIVGENNLGPFAEDFPKLGSGLRGFLDNVGTFTDEQVATVTCAANAVKTLASVAKEIPNTGGFIGMIVGENNLGPFAEDFPKLGSGLRGFLDNVGTFTEDQVATVECGANAVKTLASVAKEIPNQGGWVAAIVGDNTLGDFASQFPKLGEGIRKFLDNVGTFTTMETATVECGANAVKTLANAANGIPNQGGWVAAIVGDNTLGDFADQFPKLGEGLRGFLDNIGTFTTAQIFTVSSAISAVLAFATLADADLKGANKQIDGFGNNIVEFAKKITSFTNELNTVGSGSISKAVSSMNTVATAIRGLVGLDSKAATNFKNAINELGKAGFNKFVDAFTSSSSLTNVKKAGITLVNKFIEGVKSLNDSLETTMKTLVSTASGAVKTKDQRQKMYDAGKYLVEGFAAGISENDYKAEAKAVAMANAAAEAAEKALKINSPSKVFKKIGTSIPEGFALGIDKLSGLVTDSATNMGSRAIDGVRYSIRHIADAVDSDLDVQPSIRPVIDLSDVKSGVGTINDMLALGATLGITPHVGAINASMTNRQNGGNGDVVSAIDKLRKDIGNMGGDSYNINGVSYSDGSDVAEAIKTIIRAAKIERRV